MSKTTDAFRTISEAALELDLPQHVLRFWETRFHQIKPMKRGGGRRYYRPDDVVLLAGIKHLLYSEGYTIKAVQRLLKEHGNGFVLAVGRGRTPAELLAERQSINAQNEAAAQAALIASEAPATQPQAAQTSFLAPAEGDLMQGEVVPEGIKTDDPQGAFGFANMVMPNKNPKTEMVAAGMSAPERKKLQEALFELLECKRILDQARLN